MNNFDAVRKDGLECVSVISLVVSGPRVHKNAGVSSDGNADMGENERSELRAWKVETMETREIIATNNKQDPNNRPEPSRHRLPHSHPSTTLCVTLTFFQLYRRDQRSAAGILNEYESQVRKNLSPGVYVYQRNLQAQHLGCRGLSPGCRHYCLLDPVSSSHGLTYAYPDYTRCLKLVA
jgi:hypothetical protein